MWIFFFAGVGGWLGFTLIGVTALLPYLLRRSRVSALLHMVPTTGRPYLARMWPHFWLAYTATALALVHAWIFMTRAPMQRMNSAGLSLASLALLWLFLQMAIGLLLRQRDLRERRPMRQRHFWSMVGILVLVGVHVWLNG